MIEPPEQLPQEAEMVPWSTVPWHLQSASRTMLAVIKKVIDYVKMPFFFVFEE